ERAIAILENAQTADPTRDDVRALLQERRAALDAERADARRRHELDLKIAAELARAKQTASHQDAIAILEQAARLDAARPDVRTALAERRGALDKEREEARRAKERAEQEAARRIKERDASIAAAIAKAERTSGHEAAIAILREAQALDPGRVDVRGLIKE